MVLHRKQIYLVPFYLLLSQKDKADIDLENALKVSLLMHLLNDVRSMLMHASTQVPSELLEYDDSGAEGEGNCLNICITILC